MPISFNPTNKTTNQSPCEENIYQFDQVDQEAKRQIIMRRQRLFSHYRQYEQWRKKQFSYDSYHYRPLVSMAANKKRRLYRRQYSCVERSEGSHDSHDSKTCVGSGSEQVTTSKGHNEANSFDGADCGALSYQPLHFSSRHFHLLQEEPSTSIAERCTRSRINSAIFVSSEGRGFDSIEFLRRHGSQSVLCRKARSAENITDNERKKSFSEKRQWCTDEDTDHPNIEGEAIELNEVNRSSNTGYEANIQCTTMSTHSATVTTSNAIVGSISIETPPSHFKDDITVTRQQSQQDDSATGESGEEQYRQSMGTTSTTRPRKLVHQRSSTTSTNHSQSSPGGSPHHSPKNLSLRNAKPRNVALPMVSVSGPSPPHDKDYL